jgi:hypothetical protein
VQKWEAQESGQYVSTKMWGATQESDPERRGSSEPGRFAAPYDIGIDQWGDVYVMNTSVSQIQKFTPEGEWILSMNVGRKAPVMTEGERSHGMAVDALGNAISTETGMIMRRTEAETRDVPPMRDTPTPDTTAPKLNGFTLPEFADAATVRIHIDATDDRKPAEVRTALEDGNWGPWRPYSADLDVTLSDGAGVKGIAEQVRDAAGNESEALYHTLLRRAAEQPAAEEPAAEQPAAEQPAAEQPAADAIAPKLSSLTVPEFADGATITVSLEATDEDEAPKEMRFADENGNWGPWQPYKPAVEVTLSDGAGVKGVYAQVRDEAGNESDALYKTLLRRA